MSETSSVQVTTDVALPSLIRKQVHDYMTRFLSRYDARFGFVQLHAHLKHDGPQIACSINLVTDDGRYHARLSGWDVRTMVQEGVDMLAFQVHRKMERRAEHA
jgi:hypothetical protein